MTCIELISMLLSLICLNRISVPLLPGPLFLHATAGMALNVKKLTYATSMDVMPHPRGVGYAAVAFERCD